MWPLSPPLHGARASYETCISLTRGMGAQKRRSRLTAAAGAIDTAGEDFRTAAAGQTLHTLDPEKFQIPGIGEEEKADKRASAIEELPLHPYLDHIDGQAWLAAEVVHEDGFVRLEFFVSPPPCWDQVLTARARNHFKLFGLRRTYALQANRFIGEIRG
ncbi:hypothetical protein OOK31_24740 [Streptomyces sp. NBC_00249]|uniref:hypothetical protein n=1 Tax=Streptomyces sp. NBC_00249 TaxID=2975690 RepID=UPI002257F8CF|nr:hypothetical protein [Streptomyces sp. NBC_00249]MCX5197066.1 hypothetical protein [Streptomyces sp. NBC_00249]